VIRSNREIELKVFEFGLNRWDASRLLGKIGLLCLCVFFAGEMNTDFELVNVDSVADFTDASIRLSASSTPTYFMPGCWMPRNLLGR